MATKTDNETRTGTESTSGGQQSRGRAADAYQSARDRTYSAYLTDVPGTKNASIEAAAAQAAHDVLVGLYPTRASIFDTEFAASIEGIDQYRVLQGVRVGQRVAAAMLAVRANDGWSVTPPAYNLPSTPGNWQPTSVPATFTHYPAVTPFATQSATQFQPPPPSL